MSTSQKPSETGSVDRAINRILAAEQEARDAVENCRVEAARILSEAEERVREIDRRAERRMRAAQRIADASVARSIQRLRERGSSAVSETDEGRPGSPVDTAVEALVDEMLDGTS